MQTIFSTLTSEKVERQNTNSMDKEENSMIFKCILLMYCFFLVLFVCLTVCLSCKSLQKWEKISANFKQHERGIKN